MEAIIYPRVLLILTSNVEDKNVRRAYTMEKCKNMRIKSLMDNKTGHKKSGRYYFWKNESIKN